MSIKVSGLTHIYNHGTPFEQTAVNDVSFEIGPHEFIGIIGHTGSGKSTMIQHINRLLVPTSGTVFVNGKDINTKSYPMSEICKRVGIVFQYPEYQLFEETVYADVAFGPKNLGFDDEKVDMLVRESIELVGLDFEELRDMSPFELSGGQKRRVAIAGVLAMKPQILILDEPASGLDPMGKKEILESIRRMNKEFGICILLVSHNMDDVAEYSDRVMVFVKGELVMFDVPQQVFADTEFLENIGLSVPQSKRVLSMLAQRGFDVNTALYKNSDAIDEILAKLRK